jgi:hypothetical protein
VSGGTSRVTPPSVGDVLLAARAYGWPALQGEGVDIAPGEAGWRAAVTPETALLVWETLHEADLVDDPDDEP